MADDVQFRPDLFHGTATDYEAFRIGYPDALVVDLLRRCEITERAVLLDLACGTGQIAFALAPAFREAWAVDQEVGMIDLVRDKASHAGIPHIHPVVSPAETFDPPLGVFELVTVGNAFHRLSRDTVARRALGWLQPGGHVALLWSQPPWLGDADWQGVLSNVLDRWKTASEGRIPPGWEESRRERPDRQVMTEAGYQCLGAFDFPAEHRWTVEGLVGWFFSTSFLSRHTLGDRAAAFEADMHTSLARFGAALLQTIDFVYELYRVPVSGERSSTG